MISAVHLVDRDRIATISIPSWVSKETFALVIDELAKLEGIHGATVRYGSSKRNKLSFEAYFRKQQERSFRVAQTMRGLTNKVVQAERKKRIANAHKRRWKKLWPFGVGELELNYFCHLDDVKTVLARIDRLDALEGIIAGALKKHPPVEPPENYFDLFPKKVDFRSRREQDAKRRRRLAKRIIATHLASSKSTAPAPDRARARTAPPSVFDTT